MATALSSRHLKVPLEIARAIKAHTLCAEGKPGGKALSLKSQNLDGVTISELDLRSAVFSGSSFIKAKLEATSFADGDLFG